MNSRVLDHLDLLGEAMSRFETLARGADGHEAVPACDGWAVRDLVEHLGGVHRWAAGIVISGQRISTPTPWVTEPLADWYAGIADALRAVLRAVSPDEPVPNFSRLGETAAFWPRRQLHEVTVHAVDAAQALRVDEDEWTVPGAIAADGIDEVLEVFFPRMTHQGSRPDVRSRIRLVALDLDRSWVGGPGEGAQGTPVQLDHTVEADAVVSGTASDLYLALWHRVDRERLWFEGDDGAVLLDGPTTP